MANRFTQISTSAFDPLSLNEIMAVPLAKQKQQDALLQGASEVSAIDSKRLAGADEAVTAELEGLRERSRNLSSEILEGGYNRSIRNRFNELKNDQAAAFSSKGITGQAKAAYDKRQLNIDAVMKNKNLSQQQKQAGLNYSLNEYNKAGGGEYVDYVGADEVDVQKLALDVASQMEPQDFAEQLGIQWDGTVFRDGINQWSVLPAKKIEQAVTQYLMNDEGVASYMQDLNKIGIVSDPQSYVQNAARNAANIKAQKNQKLSSKILPAAYHKQLVDNRTAVPDELGLQGYGVKSYITTVEDYFDNHAVDVDSNYFGADGNLQDSNLVESSFFGEDGVNQEYADLKGRIERYRGMHDFGPEVSDQAIGHLINDAVKGASAFATQAWKPQNMQHSSRFLKEQYFGDKPGSGGDATNRGIRVDGMPEVKTMGQLADNLGLTGRETMDLLQTSGWLGTAPADPDFPMGNTYSFHADPDDEETINITIANDENISNELGDASILANQLKNHIEWSSKKDIGQDGQTVYHNYILDTEVSKDVNGFPIGMGYKPKMITTEQSFDSYEEFLQYSSSTENLEIQTIEDLIGESMTLYSAQQSGVAQGKLSNKAPKTN